MKIISKEELIKNISDRWLQDYCRNRIWEYGKDKQEIYEKLLKLNPLTEKTINEIIGNKSWTKNICDECGKDSDILIQFGEDWDYESETAKVCKDCLNKAVNTIYGERYRSQ